MAKKITELTPASALTGAELVWVEQGGLPVKSTTQNIADLGGGSQTPWTSDIDGGGFGLDNIDRLEIQAPGIPGDNATFSHDGVNFSTVLVNTLNWDVFGLQNFTLNRQANNASILVLGEDTTLRGDSQSGSIKLWGEQSGTIYGSQISQNSSNVAWSGIGSNPATALQMSINVQLLSGRNLDIRDSTNADTAVFSHNGTDFNTDFTNTTAWNIKDGVQVRLWDSGNTDNMSLYHTGSHFQMVGSNTTDINISSLSGNVWIRDGAGLRISDALDTDWAGFSHDGTDFNTAFVGTTDWNITGITVLQAGGVNADFNAITATSYGGITEANLLDKTAAEDLSGDWEWQDNAEIRLGTGNDARRYFNATDLFDDLNTGVDYRLRINSVEYLTVISGGAISLANNGVMEARTRDSNVTDGMSGFETKDQGQTYRQVGFVDMEEVTFTANTVVDADDWHKCLAHTDAATHTLTFNTAADVPNGVVLWVKARTGIVTLVDGTMVLTLYAGAALTTGNISVAIGGWATIHKTGDSAADVTGVGLT